MDSTLVVTTVATERLANVSSGAAEQLELLLLQANHSLLLMQPHSANCQKQRKHLKRRIALHLNSFNELTKEMSTTKMSPNVPQIISTNRVEEIRFSVVQSFENFNSRNSEERFYVDSKTLSPPGKPDGPHFFLRMHKHPPPYEHTNDYYFNLEFHLASSSSSAAVAAKWFKVRHSTAIVSQSGEKYGQSEESHFTTNKEKSWHLFKLRQRKQFDNSNGLLPNDTLTFRSEFTFYLDHDNEKVFFSGKDKYETSGLLGAAQQQIITDLENLYVSKTGADVILQSGDCEFPAHKALLIARSPVFASMFKHSTTKESMEGRVVIKDVSAKVLQLLLAFLYTGLVNLEGDEELTVELLAAADKYEVDSLKAICSEQLAAGLSAQSMFATLHFAEQYSAPELKSKVVDFIANQTSIQEKVKALLDVNDSPEKVIAFLQKVAQL